MSDLSPETDKLLELARGASVLTDARRAHIKAGLLSQIAAGGALGGAASHAVWGKAAWVSSPLAKGISALALLSAVGVGVGVYAARGAPRAASSAAATAVAPVGTANAEPRSAVASASPIASAPAAKPMGEPAIPQFAQAVASAPSSVKNANSVRGPAASESPSSAAVAPSADTLAAETRLLRDADQALRAGNAQRALALLDEHAARFPHGVLEPERTAERMIARCKLGQIDAKSAQSYLAAHANSSFAARLQDACSSVIR